MSEDGVCLCHAVECDTSQLEEESRDTWSKYHVKDGEAVCWSNSV